MSPLRNSLAGTLVVFGLVVAALMAWSLWDMYAHRSDYRFPTEGAGWSYLSLHNYVAFGTWRLCTHLAAAVAATLARRRTWALVLVAALLAADWIWAESVAESIFPPRATR